MKKQTASVLIVYFSRSGNTRAIANLIQQEVGGTLHELETAAAYPPAYNAVVEQAKREIRTGYRPPLRSTLDNIEAYATIFIGTPNWWDTLAPPVATFLSEHDFSGKTIAPFCTHGGGGAGNIPSDLARLCPGATVLEHLALYGNGGEGARAEVSAWLRGLGMP